MKCDVKLDQISVGTLFNYNGITLKKGMGVKGYPYLDKDKEIECNPMYGGLIQNHTDLVYFIPSQTYVSVESPG